MLIFGRRAGNQKARPAGSCSRAGEPGRRGVRRTNTRAALESHNSRHTQRPIINIMSTNYRGSASVYIGLRRRFVDINIRLGLFPSGGCAPEDGRSLMTVARPPGPEPRELRLRCVVRPIAPRPGHRRRCRCRFALLLAHLPLSRRTRSRALLVALSLRHDHETKLWLHRTPRQQSAQRLGEELHPRYLPRKSPVRRRIGGGPPVPVTRYIAAALCNLETDLSIRLLVPSG